MSTKQLENGKVQKKRKHKQKPVLERAPQQQQVSDDGNSKFARTLGSTDYATRDKGVQALSKFLVYKEELPELDMMKLWKGLFFCFWHSDKVPVQTELAERLAGLLPQMHPRMAQLYWAGLLATLRREWFAMDHHRIDKFLMLVRKFVAALLMRLQAAHWNHDAISSLTLQLPLDQTLVPTMLNKSLGLSYHLSDVWLQELRKVAAAAEQPVPHDSMVQLLEPFVLVLEGSGEQALVSRVKDSVFDALASDIAAAAAAENSSNSDSDDESSQQYIYCQQLDADRLAAQLFERGAAEGVKARNRQALYSVSKDLGKAAGRRRKRTAAADESVQQQQQQQQQGKQKKQKHSQQQEQQQLPQQQQAVEVLQHAQQQEQDEQQGASASKKKHKKHRQAAYVKPQGEQQQQQPPAVDAATPVSSKKQAHKAQHSQQQQQQLLEDVAAGKSPAAAAAAEAAAAATPQAASLTPQAAHKSSKKKKKHSMSAAAEAEAICNGTPTLTAVAAGNSSAAKRGVVIDLKKNVYFAHGAPVPPEDVRTPPKTKPKGSALKPSSKLAPATAPAKRLGSRLEAVSGRPDNKRKPVTPSSVPRVKAAAFF